MLGVILAQNSNRMPIVTLCGSEVDGDVSASCSK